MSEAKTWVGESGPELIGRGCQPGEALTFGAVLAKAGAHGTWSYALPEDPHLAAHAVRMLQRCADQIAEIGRSGDAATAPVEHDDFDARVEAIRSLGDRLEVGIRGGYVDRVADVGEEAQGVVAALGQDDGKGLEKGLPGEGLDADLTNQVQQGGGLPLQLGQVGHQASPNDGLQGPSGEGESPVGETRPAADRVGGELTIDDLIAAMEAALPRLSADARKGLLDLIDVRHQLFCVDAQTGPAGANHIRLSLQLSDAGRRLCAALRAGDFDVLSHWASPGLGLDPQSGEGESPVGAKRPATRSAAEPA